MPDLKEVADGNSNVGQCVISLLSAKHWDANAMVFIRLHSPFGSSSQCFSHTLERSRTGLFTQNLCPTQRDQNSFFVLVFK